MKENDLLKAISDIRDEYILEASPEAYAGRRRTSQNEPKAAKAEDERRERREKRKEQEPEEEGNAKEKREEGTAAERKDTGEKEDSMPGAPEKEASKAAETTGETPQEAGTGQEQEKDKDKDKVIEFPKEPFLRQNGMRVAGGVAAACCVFLIGFGVIRLNQPAGKADTEMMQGAVSVDADREKEAEPGAPDGAGEQLIELYSPDGAGELQLEQYNQNEIEVQLEPKNPLYESEREAGILQEQEFVGPMHGALQEAERPAGRKEYDLAAPLAGMGAANAPLPENESESESESEE